MAPHPLLTIGHSNHPIDRFLALLRRHQVEAVADVRSRPHSRFVPHYGRRALQGSLAREGIGYLYLGEALGGKPPRDDVAAARLDYATRVRQPAFRGGIEQLLSAAAARRIALLCRERDPLDCHRLHLISRYLAPRHLDIRHILPDGAIEPQSETEQRLLARGDSLPLFARTDPMLDAETLQRAYDRWWSEGR